MAIANDVETTMPEPVTSCDQLNQLVAEMREIFHQLTPVYGQRATVIDQAAQRDDKEQLDPMAVQRQAAFFSNLSAKYARAVSLFEAFQELLIGADVAVKIGFVAIKEELQGQLHVLSVMKEPPAGEHKVNPAIAEMPPCTREPASFAPLTWATSL